MFLLRHDGNSPIVFLNAEVTYHVLIFLSLNIKMLVAFCMKMANISHGCGTLAPPDSLSVCYPAPCQEAASINGLPCPLASDWVSPMGGTGRSLRVRWWFIPAAPSLPGHCGWASSPTAGCISCREASPYILFSFWHVLILHEATAP